MTLRTLVVAPIVALASIAPDVALADDAPSWQSPPSAQVQPQGDAQWAPQTTATESGPIIIIVQDASPPAKPKKPKKPKHKINVPLTALGGSLVGVGFVAGTASFVGYLTSIDCSSHSGFLSFPSVDCTSEPLWLAGLGAGFVFAGVVGTPVLVAGLKGAGVKQDPVTPPTAEVMVGPTGGGIRVHF